MIKRITTALVALALLTTGAFAGVADPRPVSSPIGLCQTGVASAHTGDTTETTLMTCTVPRKYMGPNGRVNVQFRFSHTNSANNKTIKVYFGGTGGTAYATQIDTTTAGFSGSVDVVNRGATNSQYGGLMGSTGGGATSAIDTTKDTTVVITGTLANTGETITLESYSVSLTASK